MKIRTQSIPFVSAVLAISVIAAGGLAYSSANAVARPSPKSFQIELKSPVQHVASRRERIVEKLRAQGYTQIAFQGRRLFGYVVNACREGRLYRLSFDPLTIQRSSRIAGSCPTSGPSRQSLDIAGVRRVLRDEGYYAIRFTDRQLPRYAADACRDDRRFALRINRFGEVLNATGQGRCTTGSNVTLASVRQKLRAQGFYRIRPVSRDLPPTRVEACKSGRRYAIRLSRSGDVLDRSYEGNCEGADTLSTAQLEQRLRQRSYYRINLVREAGNRVVFEACRVLRRFRLRVNASGQILSRSAVGWCAPGRDRVARNYGDILNHFPSGETLNPEDCDDYLSALLDRTRIRFSTNSSEISARSERLLEEVGYVMNRCPSTKIEVAGHTDSRGSQAVNDRLSRERARAVVRYLVRNHNVQRNRLEPAGYGESRPIASNDTERGRRQNRRIEMVVLWDAS